MGGSRHAGHAVGPMIELYCLGPSVEKGRAVQMEQPRRGWPSAIHRNCEDDDFATGRWPYDDFAVQSGLTRDYIMYIMVLRCEMHVLSSSRFLACG